MLDDEMLTIEELAAYLKLKPQTIYKWAQSGKIPGAKFGKEWRFRRSAIEQWIDERMRGGGRTRGEGDGAGVVALASSGEAPSMRGSSGRSPAEASAGTEAAVPGIAAEAELARDATVAAVTAAAVSAAGGGGGAAAGGGAIAAGAVKGGTAPGAGPTGPGCTEGRVKLPEGRRGARSPAGKGQGDALGATAENRAGAQRGVPVEKVATARRGSRASRKERGPDSN